MFRTLFSLSSVIYTFMGTIL